ncbi:muramidase [Mesorhizobium denitrificans]|uniref:Muramidase n=1 Tax=Mesorhizobium denitrificans TaxID=2294114 RepID=A0A371XIW9_9HYPH|nr:muramidase [Mesorhizobium denitrificans]
MLAVICVSLPAVASEFSKPWTRPDRALVLDAYEYNELDWRELAQDKRIVAFINKASDGLPPPYFCTGQETEYKLCKALWKRHAVARELFQTRRTLAKALGLKWGAYHLARPGNPLEQARNFLDFAEPEPDDLMALDIEDNDPSQWMSLDDAEIFVREINRRTGRFPMLYTNGTTAKHIADNAWRYRLLSRLPLWYARYKPEIGMHFPKGNWDSYALWQFASQVNCNKRACPYRVKGAGNDIDVNVSTMSPDELRDAWPFGGLVQQRVELVASVPVPFPREKALTGEVEIIYAAVSNLPAASENWPAEVSVAQLTPNPETMFTFAAAYLGTAVSAGQAAIERWLGKRAPGVDMTATAAIAPESIRRSDMPVFLLTDGSDFSELLVPQAKKSAF